MIQALYTGAMGARAQQTRMDVLAGNVSNANTNGYKAVGTQFRDALYFAAQDPADAESTRNLQVGTGVLVNSTLRDFTQGAINVTGEPLDLCLAGEGFFAVQGADGETSYTRDGTFNMSVEEDGDYLVTADGLYVLDNNNQRIALQGNLSDVVVNQAGAVSTGAEESYAQLGLYTFTNLNGLSAVGSNQYRPTVNSGEPMAPRDLSVQQGALEFSGTNLALEITRMIRSQRALSFAARCITTVDTMEGQTNSIRR